MLSAMFGFLGRFGRARELVQLDRALRAVDLHPALAPEALKLTVVRLVRDAPAESGASPDYAPAAALIAYCMVGAEAFAGANGAAFAEAVETRIERAVESGDSLDARLVLLTLHAGVIQPSVVAEFGLESGTA